MRARLSAGRRRGPADKRAVSRVSRPFGMKFGAAGPEAFRALQFARRTPIAHCRARQTARSMFLWHDGMTFRIRFDASAAGARRLTAAIVCALPILAGAASLNITVADANGAPLADAVALLEPATGKAAVKPMPDVEISQAKRQFSPRVTLITTGTKATFPNFDTVRHQVYSFSPIKTFELKLYAGVPGAPITFDKPGIAVLGCNIHDNMAAWVVVSDTPWFARSAADGRARIDGVPAGSYRLRLWHPGLPPNTEPEPVAITIGAADVTHGARLAVRNEP
jgi:plastocyanin